MCVLALLPKYNTTYLKSFYFLGSTNNAHKTKLVPKTANPYFGDRGSISNGEKIEN